jgi:uncharacterized membrane protein
MLRLDRLARVLGVAVVSLGLAQPTLGQVVTAPKGTGLVIGNCSPLMWCRRVGGENRA